MANLKVLETDEEFQPELQVAGTKLVVVNFTASWCGPCQRIAPIFLDYSNKYPDVKFIKVDVDKCQMAAAGNAVTSMPTFIFFINKVKIDTVRGADAAHLEAKIIEHKGKGSEKIGDVLVPGHVDLASFITKSQCECLNESDSHPLAGCLDATGGYLESDCDEQLIISLTFQQAVKLHSLLVKGPTDKGPKTIRIFINQTRTLDFDSATSSTPVQEVILTPKDLEGAVVPLRFVKFQNVTNLQLFIKDNQANHDTTRIDHLTIIGSPIITTKMEDFKRIAGKKGEAH